MWKPSSSSKAAHTPRSSGSSRCHPGVLRYWLVCCVHVWLFILAVKCQDDEFPPRSLHVNPGQMSKEHDNKILSCKTSSNPMPSFRWLKDGVAITNRSSNYLLYIDNISRAVAGQYRCEASNKFGAILSNPAHVEVAYQLSLNVDGPSYLCNYMDQFTEKDRPISMVTNVSAALIIPLPQINSYPVPDVTWKLNQQPLNVEGARFHVTLDRSLVLLDRELSDNASYYQPQAINGNSVSVSDGPIITVTVKAVSGVGNRQPPQIVVPVVDNVAIQDRDVQVNFECIVNARPVSDVDISWFRVSGAARSQILRDEQKYIMSNWKRRLTIKQPLLADAGTYECEASLTGVDYRVTSSANLTVYVQPSFTSQFLETYNRDFGQSITISCQGDGHPAPTVHWYFNAQPISSTLNSRYTVNQDGSLTVAQVDLPHSGMYQCFIRNVVGETSKALWLLVNSSPPVMVTSPSNLTVVEDSDARFPCETQGAPLPVVSWSKVTETGVVPISPQGRTQIMDRGELLIASTIPSDTGTYMCNASNSKGSVTASASLVVFIRTRIMRPPQDLSVIKGTNAAFLCGVSHDAGITVTWTWTHYSPHTGQTEVISSTDSRHSIADDGTLSVTGINNIDIGDYTCAVVSAGGNDSRTVSLTVIELPHKPVITSVVLHATDVRAVVLHWSPGYDGNTPILRYSIQYAEVNQAGTGGTVAESDWLSYGLDIGADDRSATVTHLRPASFYQFRLFASNTVGEGDASVPKPVPPLEMPQQPPSASPRGFYGVAASNTSIVLHWQPPLEDKWNGPLLGYSIRHKLAGYRNDTFQTVNVTNLLVNPRYALTGLAFFQGYEIMIAAYNVEGVGVFSSLIYVRTQEGHPTAPPQNFEAVAVNSTSIRATWEPPNQQFINGYNLGYKLEGRQTGVPHTEFVVVASQDPANPTGQQETHITGLRKFTAYTITVLCYTGHGDGPRTSSINTTTQEDVPGMVGQLNFVNIRDTSLKVVWTPPTDINGILLGYTLMYEKKNESSTRRQLTLSPTNLTYTIYNLNPTTWYTIYVHAFTAVGPGPDTLAAIESGVPPELPEPPYDLGVSNIQARSVRLQFRPGFDGKTTITLWIVQAWEGDDATQWKDIYTISDPDATSIKVQNLQPFTRYQLRILAENIVDKSNPSEASQSFQTLQDAPGVPPGNVTVRALNATAVRVSWTPLAKKAWNGNPRGYKIYYKMKASVGSFHIVDLDNGMNMDSAILGPLEEWIEYEVKMLAYNDVGFSSFSPVTVERTRESVPSSGPVDVHAVAVSSTSVNVTWGELPELDRNGMILGFKVQYRSSEENIAAQFADVVGNTSSSVLIGNLRKFVQYEIRVLAYTRMGDGVLSLPEITVKTKADVPGPPVIVWFPEVTYTTAKVIWDPPLEPNGIITGYMVSYHPKDSDDAYTNSSVISPTERHHKVTGLGQQAHYEFRVTARTSHGWGATASVMVFTMVNRTAPDSPSKPSIMSSQVQARTVTISWVVGRFNGYGPLRNFTVQYKMGGQQWVAIPEAIRPDITTYMVTGLRPNSRYVFRVAATNDIGTSSYSVQSDEVKTKEDLPEGAPRYVTVKPLTTTSVRVSWEQPLPSTWNGEIYGYVVRYHQVEMDSFQEERVEVTVASKVLSNLIKFVNYEFLVIAFNTVGQGPASTPVTVFVGEAAPTAAPVNITPRATNSTEILVSWLPPPAETHNGVLSGYKVSYWLATDSESSARQIIVREQRALLQQLHIYSNYAITLQAYNLAGEGPRSAITYHKTMEGLPERPANLSFWNITYVSLDVSWAPPVNPNGVILTYDLSYIEQSINGGSKLVKFSLPGSVNYHSIVGLGKGRSYQFSVGARTSVGPGEQTSRSVTTGPQTGSPGRPLRPRVDLNVNTQTLTILWDNGEPGATPIYAHIIQARSKDSDWETILDLTGQQTRAEISYLNLTPNSDVQFRVVAMNSIGISPYSDPSETLHTPAPAVLEPERPFHQQWWFLVIVALAGLIIVLVVISLLCLVGRSNAKNKKPGSATSTSNLAPASAEPEEGGFGNMEMTRQSRRQQFAGIRNGSAKTSSIYARSPPRPSPASVAYSDDDDTPSMVKPPIADDDSNSSTTEKNASEFGDSTQPSDDESDVDSIDPPLPPPPPTASPPPPPFSTTIRNQYINEPVQNTWQQNNSSFNAYQYTDSEAESSHYAMSLNSGQIVMNNTAGSRAPLPGYSSFV